MPDDILWFQGAFSSTSNYKHLLLHKCFHHDGHGVTINAVSTSHAEAGSEAHCRTEDSVSNPSSPTIEHIDITGTFISFNTASISWKRTSLEET